MEGNLAIKQAVKVKQENIDTNKYLNECHEESKGKHIAQRKPMPNASSPDAFHLAPGYALKNEWVFVCEGKRKKALRRKNDKKIPWTDDEAN